MIVALIVAPAVAFTVSFCLTLAVLYAREESNRA